MVKNSVLSPDVRINSYSEVDDSILFSHVNVGRHCRIRKAIIDRDVHIPEGTTIGYDPEADRQRYFVTDSGITVVTRDYSLFENPVTVDYPPFRKNRERVGHPFCTIDFAGYASNFGVFLKCGIITFLVLRDFTNLAW